MIVFDKTSLAFVQRATETLKEIISEADLEVRRSRFVFRNYLYPINVVVYEGRELAHFNSSYYQIGLNRRLIYQAKDSVLRDILKHEFAHYLTFLMHGLVDHHGEEFHQVCRGLGFSDEIARAAMNVTMANESKEGDLSSERVLEKVKKLLQLAQSSNAHEAELATLKANELLLRHNLDHIKADEEPLYLDRVMIQKRKDSKMTAIYDILRHFLVKPVISSGKHTSCIEISGSLTNVKLARYVAEFLEREFESLWKEAQSEHKLSGLRAKNSFFLGVARGFDEKMKSSKQAMTATDQRALIVVEKDLNEKVRQIYRRLSSSHSGHQLDQGANEIGVSKGKNLSIRQGVEGQSKNLYLGYSKS